LESAGEGSGSAPINAEAEKGAPPQSLARVGAPVGNKNARKHGACVAVEGDPAGLRVRIDDLVARIDRLSAYIDAHFDALEPDQIKARMALHGQLSSRLGRLKRDQCQLTGDEGDELADAIHQSLVALSEAWGDLL
jgi:hypothetical protein